jgi:hypothetical protein
MKNISCYIYPTKSINLISLFKVTLSRLRQREVLSVKYKQSSDCGNGLKVVSTGRTSYIISDLCWNGTEFIPRYLVLSATAKGMQPVKLLSSSNKINFFATVKHRDFMQPRGITCSQQCDLCVMVRFLNSCLSFTFLLHELPVFSSSEFIFIRT